MVDLVRPFQVNGANSEPVHLRQAQSNPAREATSPL
jgi:hypothetical protein